MNNQRFVITGAPSTGKSTVIKLLSEQHLTFPEAARKVIQQQLYLNSNKVPWLDNYEFSKLVVQQQIEDHSVISTPTFYDRGVPDVIAYLKHFKQDNLIAEFMSTAYEYRYAQQVFLMPPWEIIYQNDVERKESFEDAVSINKEIIDTYRTLNYEIVEVPFVNSTERVKFILDQINL